MEYRKLPHGEEKISVIGMGSSVVGEQKEEDIIKTVEYALDAGINYFDMAGGHASIFPAYGKVMARRRKEAMLQVHFGANYMTGEYGWTTDLDTVKRSVDWQLKNLQTDYIDFGQGEFAIGAAGDHKRIFWPIGKKLQKGDIL